MQNHQTLVSQRFGQQADAYLRSAVHAQGEEFARLRALVAERDDAQVLDLGCGAGHVSFQVAASVAKVVACDLSAAMLASVAQSAQERGLSNIETIEGAAEALPFASARFDFVFSRYSAHHWQDWGLALRETRRVLKPGGQAVFIDVASPGEPLLDTCLQTLEILRDPSHVRDYSAAQWLAQLAEAGLMTTALHRQRLRLEFASWVERMRTPPVFQAAILALQQAVGQEVRDYFEVSADGSFTTDVLVIETERR
jgi:ubiquinone/menaquinone biosynthesis C-methylase UbiE